MKELVLVHGRDQHDLDSIELKADWLAALARGLAKSGLTLPIPETAVRFPFYGDALRDQVHGLTAEDAAQIVIRGELLSDEERNLQLAMLEALRQRAGITEDQVRQLVQEEVVEKGIQNWPRIQAVLRSFDRYFPGGSGAAVSLVTRDVSIYLRNSSVREEIEDGVSKAIRPGIETVVVGHSLGSVVTYDILRQRGKEAGWRVPLFVTVGSPLSLEAVKNAVRSFAPPLQCPPCVQHWYNARDPHDVVALYDLNRTDFPLDPPSPAIENTSHIANTTENKHSIDGYLDDAEVARRIHAALV